jgi:hypothetical protein
MYRTIAADETWHAGCFYAARRHTIQLDFEAYMRDLKKEVADVSPSL